MKEYKHNEELLEHLKNKNVIIDDDNIALNIIDNYSYYSVINTYKCVFKKDDNTYFKNVHFNEIYAHNSCVLSNLYKKIIPIDQIF